MEVSWRLSSLHLPTWPFCFEKTQCVDSQLSTWERVEAALGAQGPLGHGAEWSIQTLSLGSCPQCLSSLHGDCQFSWVRERNSKRQEEEGPQEFEQGKGNDLPFKMMFILNYYNNVIFFIVENVV